MHDMPIEPMRADNVEEFDVRIIDAHGLVVSVVPLLAPWSASAEEYPLNQSA